MTLFFRTVITLAILAAFAATWTRTERVSGERSYTEHAPTIAGAGERNRREADPRRPARIAGRGSLDGTQIPGGLFVDDGGNFVATRDAMVLFEYFFATSGEYEHDAIVAAIRAELGRRLEQPAEAQALAFLERYLAYRERGTTLAQGEGEEDLRSGFERMRALRREVFGEEVTTALFGEEEAIAEVALRKNEIAADPELSAEQKKAEIEALHEELPESARESMQETEAAVKLAEDEARLRARGGSDEEIRELRVERFGEDAADRLEALDAERAEWDRRYSAYRSERVRILANTSVSEADRRAMLETLVAGRFDERERIRVEAFDSIESTPSPLETSTSP
jgi:lipase chaperone LimK